MIDFTLGICCLSRDFPADTRRLGRKGRMRSRFSALLVEDGRDLCKQNARHFGGAVFPAISVIV